MSIKPIKYVTRGLTPAMPPKRQLTKAQLHMVECKKRARLHLGLA